MNNIRDDFHTLKAAGTSTYWMNLIVLAEAIKNKESTNRHFLKSIIKDISEKP